MFLPEPANPLEARMARLEGSYEIGKRLNRVEVNLSCLEDKMEARFNQVETNLGRLEDRVEARFNQVDVKIDGLRNLTFLLFGMLAGLITIFEFMR